MTEALRLVIGSDDAGFDYKEILKNDLEGNPAVASLVDVEAVRESRALMRCSVARESGV